MNIVMRRGVEHRMSIDLGGRAGIVTGAASGIGREIAARLFLDGASLVAADVDGDALDVAVKELRELAPERADSLIAVTADVAVEADVKRVAGECAASCGRIDFLVSNAGIVGPYGFEETSAREWDGVFDVNTKGGFLCARHALPYMKQRGSGRIVFIASTNGGKPGGYLIAYRASKAALIMLARSLALLAAPYGVAVNAVCPGVTMTPLQRNLTRGLTEARGVSFDEYVSERKKRVPMGRFTEVGDVADLVEFLVSDNAGFITGQALYVNGGEW